MDKTIIKDILNSQKQEAVKINMNIDKRVLDVPAINEDLNNMVESIYIELDAKLHKGKITQEEFDDFWQYTQDYCSFIQI